MTNREKSMFKKLATMFDSFSKELEKQADEFKESDHPRSADGKFTSGAGSTGRAKKETKSEKTTQSKVEHYPYRESRDLIANAKNDIADNPPANPSNPSVKLTAFDDPTKRNKIKDF